jgi:hypothetical protein
MGAVAVSAADRPYVMQQGQPIEYQRARVMTRGARRRRVSARITVLASLATAGGFVFLAFHSDDRDPLQWPSAMFTVGAGSYAFVMTLYHWVVLVPMLRARERQSQS